MNEEIRLKLEAEQDIASPGIACCYDGTVNRF
ncbi:hypothetical protein Enr8_44830 [Blastopirellula retiformator]|uniref:Uncharacterized protein n=1 Tax=Blastopirellula retiformator TaxID=2527970 RepID=A0A5C5UUN0_9BACT|nr:hypothetical protein Enr8_44830 [Blastopirellula retiformator]